MNQEAFRILEFDSIRKKVSAYANSDSARELAENLLPADFEIEKNHRMKTMKKIYTKKRSVE